jgi:hypothetical protein
MPLLEYPVQFHLFRDHGRLNPEVPLEEAGDCGANALFLLGLIEVEDAVELSRKQNICWRTKEGKESTPRYVFKTYIFTDRSKKYEAIEFEKNDLLLEVQKLKPGFGTFLFMKDKKNLGHSACIYKNIESHEIEIADLQTEEIISDDYEPGRIDDYLRHYQLFYIPGIVDTPSKDKLGDSHGSPAKTIPRPISTDSYSSPVKGHASEPYSYKSPEKLTRSPTKGHAASEDQSYKSPAKLTRSHGNHEYENLNAYRSHVRSPLSPLPQKRNRIGGTKRKRKTRRKN